MATVALTQSPATLNDGTAATLDVTNAGATDAYLGGSGGSYKLRPGQNYTITPGGVAVTGYVAAPDTAGSVTTTATAATAASIPAVVQTALDLKVPTSRTVTAGTGLTGGGTLAADRTLTVAYGTSAGSATEGNDSRVTGAVQTSRQVIAGTGLTGGGTLAADRTLTVAYGATSTTAAAGNDYRLTDRRVGAPIAAGGEWCRSRDIFQTCATPLTSGRLELTYFVATVTETINTVKIWTSGTAAATITTIRYGVFTVAGNGDLTLVASTANDTALLIATNTPYGKALSAPWSKTAGTLYAAGLLVVATTMPTLMSDQSQGSQVAADVWFVEPRRCAYVASLSDLPSTVDHSLLLATRRHPFVEFTP